MKIKVKIPTRIKEFKKRLFKFFSGKRGRIILVIILFASVLYLAKGIFIAAMVNGKPILRISVISELEKQGGSKVLDSIITKELIFQEASKMNVNVSDEEINAQIELIKKSLAEQEMELEAFLSMQGMTQENLSDSIRMNKIIEKLIGQNIKIEEAEIEKYFKTNLDTFSKGVKLVDVRQEIITNLTQQKLSEEYPKWIGELKQKSSVKYFTDYSDN